MKGTAGGSLPSFAVKLCSLCERTWVCFYERAQGGSPEVHFLDSRKARLEEQIMSSD